MRQTLRDRAGALKGSRSGVTLTELMVATAILTIGILGFFGAFRYITQSLHVSRVRTLATNLAQEKIETLKNLSYYELLITTPTYGVDSTVTPAVSYDQNNYPPETVSIGGVTFTRYTFVAMAQINSDVISTVTWTYPDTGMKQITSTIIWQDASGTKRSWTLTNLLENPNVNPLDASLSGYVNKPAGTPLSGAVVKVEQNTDWNALTDSNGYYSFRVFHGSYTVRASSASYWDGVSPINNVTAGSSVNVATITLTLISSGTINGEAWYNPDLVIGNIGPSSATQVGTAGGGYANQTVEYWTLFNPTTATIAISDTLGLTPYYTFNYYGLNAGADVNNSGFNFHYVSTAVASNQYYLIANTSFFLMGGTWHYADAYYPSNWPVSSTNKMSGTSCGTITMANASGNSADRVGWDGTGGLCNGGGRPINYNGNFVPLGGVGLGNGNQLVRVSSPAAGTADLLAYGKAYNSGNNANDFIYPSIAGYTGVWAIPNSTRNGQQAVITGVPAVGSYVNASDPFSGSTKALSGFISSGTLSLQVAPFSLVGVGTSPVAASCAGNCWTVTVATNGYFASISTVAIGPVAGAVVGIPNAASVPAWIGSGMYHVEMTNQSVGGFVKGNLTDVNGAKISGIDVSVTGVSPDKFTGSNGDYFAATQSSGAITIVVNPNNANTSYVQLINMVTVNTGQITTADFVLLQGGALQGYVTSGTTPLPNYVFTAYAGDGSQAGQAASNASGVFTIHNLSTGTYVVQPTLDSGQSGAAATLTAGVAIQNDYQMKYTLTTPGSTIFLGTVTVNGAFGTISGSVTNNGATVTSGALVVASSATISSPPPAVIASSAPALSNVIYSESSKADGTYSLPVRGYTSYYLSVFVPTVSNSGTVSITTKTYSNIYVTPSNTTTQNVTLP